VLAVVVAMLAVLFIAPQQTEFGAKVALLGSLTVFSAVLKYIERSFPAAGSEDDRIGVWVRRATPLRGLMIAVVAVVFGFAVVAAGGAARSPAAATATAVTASGRPTVQVDSASLPQVTISEEAGQAYEEVDEQRAQDIARDVVVDLEVEAMALRARDPVLAATATARSRLASIEQQIVDAGPNGDIVVSSYTIESMEVVLSYTGFQSSPLLGVQVRGMVREVTYGGLDGTTAISETESPFEAVFVVVESQAGYYVIVDSVSGS